MFWIFDCLLCWLVDICLVICVLLGLLLMCSKCWLCSDWFAFLQVWCFGLDYGVCFIDLYLVVWGMLYRLRLFLLEFWFRFCLWFSTVVLRFCLSVGVAGFSILLRVAVRGCVVLLAG